MIISVTHDRFLEISQRATAIVTADAVEPQHLLRIWARRIPRKKWETMLGFDPHNERFPRIALASQFTTITRDTATDVFTVTSFDGTVIKLKFLTLLRP